MEILLFGIFVIALYFIAFKLLSISNSKTLTENEREELQEIEESFWDEIVG